MQPQDLIGEVEDLLRTMPTPSQLHHAKPENVMWLGRAAAIMDELGPTYSIPWDTQAKMLGIVGLASTPTTAIITLLHKARYALRMKVTGPQSVVLQPGEVFDYYDSLRGIIEQATTDILFVDPYLEADFVARYLPHVKAGVSIRLLAREKVAALIPSVKLFSQQHAAKIQVRSELTFHDRFVFVDCSACYQSSGSFKDGGKKSPVVILPLTDASAPLLAIYEAIWASAKLEV